MSSKQLDFKVQDMRTETQWLPVPDSQKEDPTKIA